MPETSARPPPRLVVSRPIEVPESREQRPRRRRAKEHGRTSSSEWTDVEESPPPRRRRSKRVSSQRREREKALGSSSSGGGRVSTSSLGRFIPNLGGIEELAESTAGSRPSTRGSDQGRHSSERGSGRRSGHREHTSSRPPRHRTGGVQRRAEKAFKVNPSLLSVVSGSTGVSDRSSGSGSTITQESYNRDHVDEPQKKMDASPRAKSPNVFDYMDNASTTDIDDTRSVASSAPSSHYQHSDAGSSVAPETPSSQSTFPSPTASRRLSGSEIRAKYDREYAASMSSGRSGSRSPDPSTLGLRHRPSIEDIPEHEEESNTPGLADPREREQRRRSTSRSSSMRSSRRGSDHRLQFQEEAMRQHMSFLHHQQQHGQGHYIPPPMMYAPQREHSASPMHSEPSPQQRHLAMQQYQWPQPPPHPPHPNLHPTPPPPPPEASNGHITRPEAPNAPTLDPQQPTLTGYELLALELSFPTSQVKPCYRKFSYLNHRILLHLQDELAELEEQLRHLDEIIAQMMPSSPPASPGSNADIASGSKTGKIPSSRRAEAWGGSELHYRRTELLGRIFVKTEQYQKAMRGFAEMEGVGRRAGREEVEGYRRWMEVWRPVHEIETRFLQRGDDLFVPGRGTGEEGRDGGLACWPVALVLPVLLFAVVPTLAGRLLVMVLLAGTTGLVASTTELGRAMDTRRWAGAGAAYAVVMAALLVSVPGYGDAKR